MNSQQLANEDVSIAWTLLLAFSSHGRLKDAKIEKDNGDVMRLLGFYCWNVDAMSLLKMNKGTFKMKDSVDVLGQTQFIFKNMHLRYYKKSISQFTYQSIVLTNSYNRNKAGKYAHFRNSDFFTLLDQRCSLCYDFTLRSLVHQ